MVAGQEDSGQFLLETLGLPEWANILDLLQCVTMEAVLAKIMEFNSLLTNIIKNDCLL